jgi:hypothetical protein
MDESSRTGSARLHQSRAFLSAFQGNPFFSLYKGTKSYMALTVLSTAEALLTAAPQPSQTAVYVDGLPKSRLGWFGTELRRLSVQTSKVVGIRRQETDPLMRLADAVAGFARAALSAHQPEMAQLLAQAQSDCYLKEV